MPDFLGLPCVELKNDALSMLVTQTVGPRILSLRIHGGENLFAEVPDFTLDCPGVGKCHLWGGHRFWVAPEDPGTTYLPDDRPVEIEPIPLGLTVTQPREESTGLQKSLTVCFASSRADDPRVVVDHTLTNCGSTPATCAPWAITQFKPGGFASLRHSRISQDKASKQPDRQFSLWPITDLRSHHIDWCNTHIFVHARMISGELKLGIPEGVLSYFRARTLFVKVSNALYRPRGASSECYCNNRFLELETLGPLVTIEPGNSVTHRESWSVYDNVDLEATEASFSAFQSPDLRDPR